MHLVNEKLLSDLSRQVANLLAAPLIWICSSLGFFVEAARSPSDFSDLSENLLVPQSFAFSIWFPIFIGIFGYSLIQLSKRNRIRPLYRTTGWWVAAGLWGIVAWGLVTSFAPDAIVEVLATLIFLPTVWALVVAMTKLWKSSSSLSKLEKLFVLAPISLIAGWCSIAVFVGMNGLIWSLVQSLGWNIVGTGLSVLGLALWWAIFILRQKAANKIYAFPIIWGLGFLALRHFQTDGSLIIGTAAVIGIVGVCLACTVKVSTYTSGQA